MPYLSAVNAKTFFLGSATTLALLLSMSLFTQSVFATESTVGVAVCGGSGAGSSIEVTEPLSDSLVTQPDVTLRGTVANATQIEVAIDGQYVSSIALGSGQTTFETTVTLGQGTHTLVLKANDVCQQQDATDSVVVTYEPAEQPSSGPSTPTVVNGGGYIGPSLPGTVPDVSTPPRASVPQVISSIPVIGGLARPLENLFNQLGFSATFSGESAFVAISRVGISVVALSVLVFASTVSVQAVQMLPALDRLLPKGTSHGGHRLLTGGFRIGSLALLALAYFI